MATPDKSAVSDAMNALARALGVPSASAPEDVLAAAVSYYEQAEQPPSTDGGDNPTEERLSGGRAFSVRLFDGRRATMRLSASEIAAAKNPQALAERRANMAAKSSHPSSRKGLTILGGGR